MTAWYHDLKKTKPLPDEPEDIDFEYGQLPDAEWQKVLDKREEQRKKRKEVEDYNAMLRYVSVD